MIKKRFYEKLSDVELYDEFDKMSRSNVYRLVFICLSIQIFWEFFKISFWIFIVTTTLVLISDLIYPSSKIMVLSREIKYRELERNIESKLRFK